MIVQALSDEVKYDYEYVRVEKSTSGVAIWYSRYYGGGAFEGAARVTLRGATLTIDSYELKNTSRSNRCQLIQSFDLADPNSFDQIKPFLRTIFDREQTHRTPH